MNGTSPASVGDAIQLALDAYEALQSVAEEVDDEWMYIQDLTAAHRERLEAIAADAAAGGRSASGADGRARVDPAVAADGATRLDPAVAADGATRLDPAAPAALDPAVAAAIVAACEEIGRIADPHRAIDWLSTFPSVVTIALGREP